MEDKNKWEEYIAKAAPAISQDEIETKNKININWRTLTGISHKDLICSRTEFIWQAKKRFVESYEPWDYRGEHFWKGVVPISSSAVVMQNDKKVSEYFGENEDFVTVTCLGGMGGSGVPEDKDGVSSASDDDEIMFL